MSKLSKLPGYPFTDLNLKIIILGVILVADMILPDPIPFIDEATIVILLIRAFKTRSKKVMDLQIANGQSTSAVNRTIYSIGSIADATLTGKVNSKTEAVVNTATSVGKYIATGSESELNGAKPQSSDNATKSKAF